MIGDMGYEGWGLPWWMRVKVKVRVKVKEGEDWGVLKEAMRGNMRGVGVGGYEETMRGNMRGWGWGWGLP